MNVSILGRPYEIRESSAKDDKRLEDSDGYCDFSIGMCVIDAMEESGPDCMGDIESFKHKVTRHEIIHAFLAESGLREQCDWATEEMVDWLAYQFPKMQVAFQEAGCLS